MYAKHGNLDDADDFGTILKARTRLRVSPS